MNITQSPLYGLIPTGSEIIYNVFDNAVVANYKGKYVADVFIDRDGATLGLGTPTTVLKVNPNSTGQGIFDFGGIFDNYVHPDYEGGEASYTGFTSSVSEFKQKKYDEVDYPHSIHMIDQYSGNRNTLTMVLIRFYMEYATSPTEPVEVDRSGQRDSNKLHVWNAYLDWETHLRKFKGLYGWPLHKIQEEKYYIMNGSATGRFTTDAPLKQYVRENDFMTMPFFNNLKSSVHGAGLNVSVKDIVIRFYLYSAPTSAFNSAALSTNNGAYWGAGSDANIYFQFLGCGPANFINTGFPFPANWDFYTLIARDKFGTDISIPYEFHKQTDDCKGYETIRLTWLNQWGGWDYYNFTKKSTRVINKKPLHYSQYTGTWNRKHYSILGRKGGKRVINSVASEEITINSDYILETEAEWLEQLFVSSDVFILKENDYFDGIGVNHDHPWIGYTGYHQKYVEPVIVKSTTNIKKTQANDKLVQYSIEIEKSKRKRTHRG